MAATDRDGRRRDSSADRFPREPRGGDDDGVTIPRVRTEGGPAFSGTWSPRGRCLRREPGRPGSNGVGLAGRGPRPDSARSDAAECPVPARLNRKTRPFIRSSARPGRPWADQPARGSVRFPMWLRSVDREQWPEPDASAFRLITGGRPRASARFRRNWRSGVARAGAAQPENSSVHPFVRVRQCRHGGRSGAAVSSGPTRLNRKTRPFIRSSGFGSLAMADEASRRCRPGRRDSTGKLVRLSVRPPAPVVRGPIRRHARASGFRCGCDRWIANSGLNRTLARSG